MTSIKHKRVQLESAEQLDMFLLSIEWEGRYVQKEICMQALPERMMDIADPRILLNEEDFDLAANQSYNRCSIEACLTSIFEVKRMQSH